MERIHSYIGAIEIVAISYHFLLKRCRIFSDDAPKAFRRKILKCSNEKERWINAYKFPFLWARQRVHRNREIIFTFDGKWKENIERGSVLYFPFDFPSHVNFSDDESHLIIRLFHEENIFAMDLSNLRPDGMNIAQ